MDYYDSIETEKLYKCPYCGAINTTSIWNKTSGNFFIGSFTTIEEAIKRDRKGLPYICPKCNYRTPLEYMVEASTGV